MSPSSTRTTFSPKIFGIRLTPFMYANLLSWAFLFVINFIFFVVFSFGRVWLFEVGNYIKGILLNIVLIGVYFFYRAEVNKIREKSSTELLYRAFYVGFISVLSSLFIQFIFIFFSGTLFGNNVRNINIFYTLNTACAIAFFTYAFFICKSLLFVQSPPLVYSIWNTFTYILFASLVFSFFDLDVFALPFTLTLSVLLLLSMVLAGNARWVAYLNDRQKGQSIILLLSLAFFGAYYVFIIRSYFKSDIVFIDLAHSLYVWALMGFVLIYVFFSFLVVVFNVPTSAIYKKKVEEVLAFQQLTQSMEMNEAENRIYHVLLENSLKATFAPAGWLEILNNHGQSLAFLPKGLPENEALQLKAQLRKQRLKEILNNTFHIEKEETTTQLTPYESVLIRPLISREVKIGEIVLLKPQMDGFSTEQRELVETFTRQTSMAIENYRLLEKTVENERYKRELDIAQRVQKSLLPKELNFNQAFKVSAFSESAKEVGGDYYDVFQVNSSRTDIIIGDVSGKGTSAAFNMAQMKGIFQGLIQLDLPPNQFLHYANQAVSRCFEKASFITVTVISIDTTERTAYFARAGHCPTLYYSVAKDKTYYLEDKGLGLGIVRHNQYLKFLHTQSVRYQAGDIIFLYTDGICEARNSQGEEYGYERIQQFLEKNKHLPLEYIQQKFIEEVLAFCENNTPDDDYTLLILKFC